MLNRFLTPIQVQLFVPQPIFFYLLLILLSVALPLQARDEPEPGRYPTGLQFGLNDDMHSQMVRRLGVDARGRFIASASDDKTLRLWSLVDGRLIKTLRVPTGAGDEGRLYAVAVSPDGEVVAAGGHTRMLVDGQAAIYLFDPESGRITTRLGPLPEVINHLAFSPNGRFLVACLARGGGMRAFDVRSGRLAAQDADYGGSCFWADFDPHGRLVTASVDGVLRLYDPVFRRIAQKRPFPDDQPFSAVFSPDGRRIAVGSRNLARVLVVSSEDLSPQYQPDVSGGEGKLNVVAWSADGEFLFGAGLFGHGGRRVIRRWAQAGIPDAQGRGRYVDMPASADAVMHMMPLAGGQLAFAAADPLIGVFDTRGVMRFRHNRPQTLFRTIGRRLTLSENGRTVAFPTNDGSGFPLFSLDDMRLSRVSSLPAGLKPPLLAHPELPVTVDREANRISLRGQPLALNDGEEPRSLAMDPQGRFLVLGTSDRLRLFGQDGRPFWDVSVSGGVWGVNITPNRRWVVAAQGDGTIRWRSLVTGQETLAFFPHADGRRWIAWTPDNLYAASPGGDGLAGWLRNRGTDTAAQFFTEPQVRRTYLRPEVIRGAVQ